MGGWCLLFEYVSCFLRLMLSEVFRLSALLFDICLLVVGHECLLIRCRCLLSLFVVVVFVFVVSNVF